MSVYTLMRLKSLITFSKVYIDIMLIAKVPFL
jgi:hypothetical protein